jgi:peptidoglycan/LPS O-acetylase OafA/YrhL
MVVATNNMKKLVLRGLSVTGLALGVSAIYLAEPTMKTYWYLLAFAGCGIAFNAWLLTSTK